MSPLKNSRFTIVGLFTVLVCVALFHFCSNRRKIVEIQNYQHDGYSVFMEVVNVGIQHDVYLTLEKNGTVIWKDKRFDSRDIHQDVLDAYKFVVWHEDYILIGPGRLNGMPKIRISDGSLLGFEKGNLNK